MVSWSFARCPFYLPKSCGLPFHSISVCASTEYPRSITVPGSIFMLYDIFSPSWFPVPFSNIKSDLKPLKNIVLDLIFQKKLFLPNAGRERRASFLLPRTDENICFLVVLGMRSLRVLILCFSLCSGLRFCVLSPYGIKKSNPIGYWYQKSLFPSL